MSKSNFHYFGAVNSRNGLYCYFPRIFDPTKLQRLYIIYGGPGSGKSTLMKSIGSRFEKYWYTEYVHCSSDPDSLDGVILDQRVAVVDGTSPHIVSARYPGAVERIINTGECWDDKQLYFQRTKIIELENKKASIYTKVNRILRAAGEVSDEITDLISDNLNYEKMRQAASRFSQKEIPIGKEYNIRFANYRSIGAKGITAIKGYFSPNSRICVVNDVNNSAHFFIDELLRESAFRKQTVYIGKEPYDAERTESLYYPEISLFVVSSSVFDINADPYKIINMNRFIDRDVIRNNRMKLRFSRKCHEALIEGAVEYYKDAAICHTELEKIYSDAMEYKKLDLLTDRVLDEINTELENCIM